MSRLGTASACVLAGVVTLAGATQNAVTSTATVAYEPPAVTLVRQDGARVSLL